MGDVGTCRMINQGVLHVLGVVDVHRQPRSSSRRETLCSAAVSSASNSSNSFRSFRDFTFARISLPMSEMPASVYS